MVPASVVCEREDAARAAYLNGDFVAALKANLEVVLDVGTKPIGNDCVLTVGGEVPYATRVELILAAGEIHRLRIFYDGPDDSEYVGEYEVLSIDSFKLTALPLAPAEGGSQLCQVQA